MKVGDLVQTYYAWRGRRASPFDNAIGVVVDIVFSEIYTCDTFHVLWSDGREAYHFENGLKHVR